MVAVPAGPEFSRVVRIDQIGLDARTQTISANDAERLGLVRRFRLRGLARLDADYLLVPDGAAWRATGSIRAEAVQTCAATGQDVPERINARFAIRFVREAAGEASSEEEIELSEQDCDEMPVEDERIDMGEAVAQTFALNLNPYPRSADADAVLRDIGVKQEGEAGALASLKDLLEKGKDKGGR
jgi:hypothetical protein